MVAASAIVIRFAAAGIGGRNATSMHALISTAPQLRDMHALSICLVYASRSVLEAVGHVEARSSARIGDAKAGADAVPSSAKESTTNALDIFTGTPLMVEDASAA